MLTDHGSQIGKFANKIDELRIQLSSAIDYNQAADDSMAKIVDTKKSNHSTIIRQQDFSMLQGAT